MRNLNTPLRTIQGLLAVIALGLNGYSKRLLSYPDRRNQSSAQVLTNS